MSLELTINNDIKTAMLAKDKLRLETLRSIKAGILLAKTAENAIEITEDFEIKMLQKMAKQRKESATIYTQQNRQELADKELAEAEIIEQYLPKQLTEEEITVVVKEVIAAVGATSQKDMGKVMGAANKQLAGKADGRLISEIVKKLING
ncbi:MAG: GatB/YqeY domain-containing protein [Prevotellaceae bacterium]|nr:GatB/YqeY domain-containing protein [Prevotellaceae bacterium]